MKGPRVVNMNVADPSPSSKGRVGIYLGETSRSLHERAKEHVNDASSIQPKSHIVKHWLEAHPELNNPPAFKFTVQKNFKDALSRQLGEAIAIYKSKDSLLNSKNEYVTNCISRITVQEGAIERKMRDRREEEEEKAEESRILEFKRRKLEARALIVEGGRGDDLEGVRRARTPSGTDHHTSQVEKERLEDGGMKLAKLRRKLELEKSEVLKKMSNQKNNKIKRNSVQLQSSLSASSQRTAHNGVYSCLATPTRQSEKPEIISRVIGSEEGACTSTLLSNTTPSQPVTNFNSGSKRKYLHPRGNNESDSPRKRFKRILNFWDTTTQPEPNPEEARLDH